MENIEPDQFDKWISSMNMTIVMFYADWCPFCQKFKPFFEQKSQASKYKMVGAKINEDDNPLWDRFEISAVPTIIAFDHGKIAARRDAKMGRGLTETDLDQFLSEIKGDRKTSLV
jgi:thioredoxin 1